MVSIERALRDELRRVSDIPGPTDLAQKALRNLRRRRRNRIVGCSGIAAVVAFIAVALVVAPGKHESAVKSPRQQLLYSYTVGASTKDLQSYYLDPHNGRYGPVSSLDEGRFDAFFPAPTGHQALAGIVGTDDFRLIDWPIVGRVHQIADLPASIGGRQVDNWLWSPDGRRLQALLEPAKSSVGADGFAIYDVKTRSLGPLVPVHPITSQQEIHWGRSSHEIGIFGAPRHGTRTIRFVDLAGHGTGEIAVPAKGYGSPGAINWPATFSPSGRYVSLGAGAVYDTRAHKRISPNLPGGRCRQTSLETWQTSRRYVVECQRAHAVMLYSVDVTGHVRQTIRVPLGTREMPGPPVNNIVMLFLNFAPTNGYPANAGIRV